MNSEEIYRILIVDDNRNIHEDYRKVLQLDNVENENLSTLGSKIFGDAPTTSVQGLPKFILQSAYQGQEGINQVKQSIEKQDPFAVAFVDIRVPPGLDGIQTIKNIWKIDPNIQVVICTAYSDYNWSDTLKNLRHSENFLILKKPFDNIVVRQFACSLAKKWLIQKQLNHTLYNLQGMVNEKTTALHHSLSLLRSTLESTADGILVTDRSFKFVDWNERFLKMWKLPTEILELRDDTHAINFVLEQLKDPEAFQARYLEIINKPEKESMDEIYFKDGRIIERYSKPQILDDKPIGRVWSFRDITQHKYLEKQLLRQATHDILTGLPNRILTLDRLQQLIPIASTHNTQIAILSIDIKNFKAINAQYGHPIGDSVLKLVSQKLSQPKWAFNIVAKSEGNEFIVIINNINSKDEVLLLIKSITADFDQPIQILELETKINFSIGISMFPLNGSEPEILLKNANIALYNAKKDLARSLTFYNDELNIQTISSFQLEQELRRALENEEFVVYYQPLFNIVTQEIIGTEALIRWKNPNRPNLIMPDEFINLAEKTGLIITIGNWVIETACKQNKLWQTLGYPHLFIAVNVSGLQLFEETFYENVLNILSKTGLEGKYLELELTETMLIDTSGPIISLLHKINNLGVKLSIDDFGTGYSSLKYLHNFPIGKIKIDRSFVQFINSPDVDSVIVQAIIGIGKGMKVNILAEGIETNEQLEYLQKHNCEQGQGFYFSKPLSVEDCTQFMLNNKPK